MNASLKEKIRHEAKSFAVIFLYVWAILTLFTLHKNFLLEKNPFSDQLLNFINAFVLGKVIVALEFFRAGRFLERHRTIFRIFGKSVLFGLVLLMFRLVEEGIRGWFKGQPFGHSFADLNEARLMEIGTMALLIIVTLVPYFFLREIVDVLGFEKLRKLLFDPPASTPPQAR